MMALTDKEMRDSAILFAVEVIESIWENGPADMDQQNVLDVAERQGIIRWRAPTAFELSDPDWWGHEYDITAEDATGVGEIAPEYQGAANRAVRDRCETV